MTRFKQVGARSVLIAFVVFCCIAADQLSKQWAVRNLTMGQPQEFIPGLLRLNLLSNPGAAFSLGSDNGQLMGLVATVFSIAICCWIVKRIASTAPLPVVEQIGMACIFGGAVGNLIDRFNHGKVTDFLEFAFMQFPVFNVADALIDVGIAFLFIAIWFFPSEETGPKTREQAVSSDITAGSPATPREDERKHDALAPNDKA